MVGYYIFLYFMALLSLFIGIASRDSFLISGAAIVFLFLFWALVLAFFLPRFEGGQ